jgi:hypothetical protein
MYVELASGTQVKFTNCGRGIEGAVFDAAAGELDNASAVRGCDVLHVYYVPNIREIPQFICCSSELDREAIGEAQRKYEQQKFQRDVANETLRKALLGPDGLKLVSDRQNGNSDKQTASTDICKALGLTKPYTQNPSWDVVKKTISATKLVAPPPAGQTDAT